MPTTLAHSPADIARRALIAAGMGTYPGGTAAWPVYVAEEPDTPDNCVTVYDTTGLSDGRDMTSGEAWQHEGVQVRIRSRTHEIGWAEADAIRDAMARLYQMNITIGANNYLLHCFANISAVVSLGVDDPNSKRTLFTINAVTALRPL